jgi:Tfp pilus assembly protein PilV
MNKKAFSLLEVIITVGILATGIIVVLQALAFSARITGLSTDITNAVLLAKDKLQEFEFEEKQNKITVKTETKEKDKFTLSYDITEWDNDLKLYKLDMEVKWQRANREETLNLQTLLKNETTE